MTVAACAIQDDDQSARRPRVRLNRAAYISRRVRALGTNELSGGEDDDEGNSGLLQSSAHDFSSRHTPFFPGRQHPDATPLDMQFACFNEEQESDCSTS